MEWLRAGLFGVGLAAVSVGVSMIYVPAGVIAAGLFTVGIALVLVPIKKTE